MMPRYPVYVISKGRADCCLTADALIADGIAFQIVVEPQERESYANRYGDARIVCLPFSNLGLGSIPARNWVWEDAKQRGAFRHWILDDNIRGFRRWYGSKRIRCHAGTALRVAEDFADRYENVAIAGLNYTMFAHQNGKQPKKPFWLNVHVYSCLLIRCDLVQRWRGRYNEDTDLCLQVLSAGECTISLNAFMCDKLQTMSMKGGNTAELYQADGRLKMARSLERMWPGVVEVRRRFKRPQHFVKHAWMRFDTPLKLKAGLVIDDKPNEYGLDLVQLKPIESRELQKVYDAWH